MDSDNNKLEEQPEEEENQIDDKVKMYTEEDFNRVIEGYKKTLPSEEELKVFNDWKQSQLSEDEKRENQLKENEKYKTESDRKIKELMEENICLKLGISDSENIEYAIFKANKLVSDEVNFESALKQVIEGNKYLLPKYLVESKKSINTGMAQSKEAPFTNPFSKSTFDLTEQGKLYIKNPELAKKLAKQEGIILR